MLVSAALEHPIIGQSTWQSTTENGGLSSRAVDGDASGTFSDNTCTLTHDGVEINTHHPDWWTVDMGATKRVFYVKIWASSDAGGYGMGFKLRNVRHLLFIRLTLHSIVTLCL